MVKVSTLSKVEFIGAICLLQQGGVMAAGGLNSFEMVARHYHPAGYAEGTTFGAPDL